MFRQNHLIAAIALTAGFGFAQNAVVVRDTIVPLPGVSICMDGATHITAVTGHRLRSKSVDFKSLVGKPLEIRGIAGSITCKFVDVTSATVLEAGQSTTAAKTATHIMVDFFGSGSVGDVYLLYFSAGVLKTPFYLPSITGPIHLDPSLMISAGTSVLVSGTKPYKSLSTPISPAFLNVNIYDQAIVLRTTGKLEMTNVDLFRF